MQSLKDLKKCSQITSKLLICCCCLFVVVVFWGGGRGKSENMSIISIEYNYVQAKHNDTNNLDDVNCNKKNMPSFNLIKKRAKQFQLKLSDIAVTLKMKVV